MVGIYIESFKDKIWSVYTHTHTCSMLLIPEKVAHPDLCSLQVTVSPDFHNSPIFLVHGLLCYSSTTALVTELVCLLFRRVDLRVTSAKESLYGWHPFFYWPISLGISVTELRDKSKTMSLSKLEMNHGIFLSPIWCSYHSWICVSWTKAGVCKKSGNQTLDTKH